MKPFVLWQIGCRNDKNSQSPFNVAIVRYDLSYDFVVARKPVVSNERSFLRQLRFCSSFLDSWFLS